MKKFYALLSAMVIAFAFMLSCSMSTFVLTGKTYAPLAENAHVDIIMRSVPKYRVEQIGIVTVKGGNLNMQLDKARKIAREKGGDVLVLTEVSTGISGSSSKTGGSVQTYMIRTFEVARKVK